MSRLFGTDGIRGVANKPPMDSETALNLGRALAYVIRKQKGVRHRIIIGKDTRISGYMLETALESGISSMGVDTLLIGPLPTPGVAYLTKSMRANAGIMISASHNSFEDNGIKIFGPDGFKLSDEAEDEIEELMQPGKLDSLRAKPELVGKAYRMEDARGRYVVYLKSCLHNPSVFEGLKVVMDTANGAAYKIAPLVFSELGADITVIANNPDGKNINDNCGSLHPEKMCELVKKNKAFCGVAYDGDADRLIISDENGDVVNGDHILALCSKYLKQTGRLNNDSVVATSMSNFGFEKYLKSEGITLHRSDVGDRYVLLKMLEHKLNLGGEQSGHVIFLDHNTTGDGVLSSLLVISAVLDMGKPMSWVQGLFEPTPQILNSFKVKSKPDFSSIDGLDELRAKIDKAVEGKGRVVLRYSGTEAKCRVMVEHEDQELCQKYTDELSDFIISKIA